MTSDDPEFDVDFLDDIVEGRSSAGAGEASLDSLARLGRNARSLLPPGPPPEARARMAQRFAQVVDRGEPGPFARLLLWLGFGAASQPTLTARFAAGAVLILAIGGTASATTGVSPIDAAERSGRVVRSLVDNLDPRNPDTPSSPADAVSTPSATATQRGGASPSPTTPTATPSPTSSATPSPTAQPVTAAPPAVVPTASGPTQAPTVVQTVPPTRAVTPTPTSTTAASPTPATPTPGQTATPAPSPTPADGTATYAAGEAGTVTVQRSGATLTVVLVDAAPGWEYEIDRATGSSVEVHFTRGEVRVRFQASIESGEVRIEVEERPPGVNGPGDGG